MPAPVHAQVRVQGESVGERDQKVLAACFDALHAGADDPAECRAVRPAACGRHGLGLQHVAQSGRDPKEGIAFRHPGDVPSPLADRPPWPIVTGPRYLVASHRREARRGRRGGLLLGGRNGVIRRYAPQLRLLLMAADALVALAVLVVVYQLRYGDSTPP